MGTFAEIATVNDHFSFAYQGNNLPFSVSICSKRIEVCHFHFPLQKQAEVAVFS
jgi:hypothetical protein